MNCLAIDTSTEVLSIAVQRTVDGTAQSWHYSGVGGAQASHSAIAVILDLVAQAGLPMTALDVVCFGRGPGSFTGLRTACAIAQGVAFGAQCPVLPVDTLLAVAEEARHQALATQPQVAITALLDARMDEIYTASYHWSDGVWTTALAPALLRPQDWSPGDGLQALAGNVFGVYADRLTHVPDNVPRVTALPTAQALLRLAPQLLAQGLAVPPELALPLYIRDKVAKTTAERMAEKAAAVARP